MTAASAANAGRLTRQWLLLLLLSSAAGTAACHRGSEPARAAIAAAALRGSNLLLVTIDTLRADHVGAYGSSRGLTPTLDRLAREGWRFEVAHAHAPMTLPSHATIMSGRYPPANGVRDNGAFRFDRTQATLASTLASAGYRTAAFIGSFVLDARFGLNAGFERYDDRLNGAARISTSCSAPQSRCSRPPGNGSRHHRRSAISRPRSALSHGLPGSTCTIPTNRTLRRSRTGRAMRRTHTQARSRMPTPRSARSSIASTPRTHSSIR
jgi:hypothetical protein